MPNRKRKQKKSTRASNGNETYLVLNGKKLRIQADSINSKATGAEHANAAAKYFAGDTLLVRTVQNEEWIVSDSDSSEGESSDSDNTDVNANFMSFAIVAVDHDPNIHGDNLKIRWFYAKDELPVSSIGIAKDQFVFSTTIEVIDITCVLKHSRSTENLPKKINDAIYNCESKKLEMASSSNPGFAKVLKLLELRSYARTQLSKTVPSKFRIVHDNQVLVATDCLLKAVHLFADCGPISHYTKTIDSSQQHIAWLICFGPMLMGDALDQMLEICTFKAHKEKTEPTAPNNGSESDSAL